MRSTCKGIQGQDGKSRSNNSAIGARVDVKTGLSVSSTSWACPRARSPSPPLRIHAGLGSNSTVDWLRITWPDAVLQAELELPADQVTKITELQRKVSSCPHLFAWNGTRYEFVSDFGGMGGLGYLTGPGTYSPPDASEYVPCAQSGAARRRVRPAGRWNPSRKSCIWTRSSCWPLTTPRTRWSTRMR